MKVLLIQDVENLGEAGEVKQVAKGYGRNYLIPSGLAVLATPSELKQADLHRRRAVLRRERISAEMDALAKAIRRSTLTFKAKAGETGRLYGSVTTADIAEKLAEAVGQEVDRRKIILETPIKQLGSHEVTVRLSGDYTADLSIIVESLEPVAEEEPAQAEEPGAEEDLVAEGEPAQAEEPGDEEDLVAEEELAQAEEPVAEE